MFYYSSPELFNFSLFWVFGVFVSVGGCRMAFWYLGVLVVGIVEIVS